MAVFPHDDVVVGGDAERARGLDEGLRHLDVGARRRGLRALAVAGGKRSADLPGIPTIKELGYGEDRQA